MLEEENQNYNPRILELRKKYPDDTKNKSNEELEVYLYNSEVLSEIYINKVKNLIDTNG